MAALVRVSLISLLFLLTPSLALAQHSLTLKQAVDLALKQNLELQVEQEKVTEAGQTRKSVRGHFGPKVMIEGNVMVWDSALQMDLGFGGGALDISTFNPQDYGLTQKEVLALAQNMDLLTGMFKIMGLDSMDMTVRDQVTASFSATLAQPLTPLIPLYKAYSATKHMEQAANLTLEAKRAEIAFKVAQIYLQRMQAQRFEKLAQTGVQQVEAHLGMARKYQEAGLIGRQEVLKAEVELARAKDRVIQARHGAALATAGLKLYMGVPQSEKVTLTDEPRDPPPPMSAAMQSCVKDALGQRKDLKSLEKMGEAAEAGKDQLKWSLLPNISAIASYQYTHGQGTFMPENAFFGGAVLQWDVWDWGAKWFSMKAAGTKARQAKLGRKLLKEAIALEVQQAYLELRKAEESMVVARLAIKSAEEDYRIEQKRFETQSNTTTDVLDAQLALTRAELTYTTGLYSYYIARAKLAKAMGKVGTGE